MIDVDPLRRKISGESYADSVRRRQETLKAKGPAALPPEAPQTASGDKIEVSEKALLMGRIQRALAEIADIRADLVEEIKARIERDEYHVPGEDIAEKVIREAIKEMKSLRSR
ncbi:MAG: flagellar biosynthesis anti-sigma factor FlgM [bacterium]